MGSELPGNFNLYQTQVKSKVLSRLQLFQHVGAFTWIRFHMPALSVQHASMHWSADSIQWHNRSGQWLFCFHVKYDALLWVVIYKMEALERACREQSSMLAVVCCKSRE